MSETKKCDLVVIGAMKAATSTICAYLESHPGVTMKPKSEPNYFSHDVNFEKGVKWYHDQLATPESGRLLSEGSNYYAAYDLYPQSAIRMAVYNPEMKIIYMVRDPIDRIVSAWIQNRTDSGDDYPANLDLAVKRMPDVYIGQSMYWRNLTEYRKHFSDDQIFVGFLEDLKSHPDEFLKKLCDFMKIPFEEPSRTHVNKSDEKRVPTEAYTLVNKLPFIRLAKHLIPVSLKKSIKSKIFSKRASKQLSLSPVVKKEALSLIYPDATQLLKHCGKPINFWKSLKNPPRSW